MGSLSINSLKEKHPNLSVEEIARKIVDSDSIYRFAIIYTNKFSGGKKHTDIGFGFLEEEYDQYISLPNSKVLYEKKKAMSDKEAQNISNRIADTIKQKESVATDQNKDPQAKIGFFKRIIMKFRKGNDEAVTKLYLEAINSKDVEKIKTIITNYGPPRKLYGDIFYEAAKLGRKDVIKLLIDAGADINVGCNSEQYEFAPPLVMSSLDHDLNAVSLLIDMGADVNVTNKIGSTALFLLSLRAGNPKCMEIIKILIKHGASTTQETTSGQSPMKLVNDHLNNPYTPGNIKAVFEELNKVFLSH